MRKKGKERKERKEKKNRVEFIIRLTGMQSANAKVGRCLVFGD